MDSDSRGFFYRHRTFMRVLGIILVFVVILGGVYSLTLFGPQRVDSRPRAVPAEIIEQSSALEKRSNSLREQFEQRVGLRPANEEDFAILDEALAAEAEILRINAGHNRGSFDRSEVMRRLRDEHRAKALYDASRQAQEALGTASNRESALEFLEQAWSLQEQINRDYARSTHVNQLRSLRLRRELDHMKAEPLYKESLAAELAAKAADKDGNWSNAVTQLQRAVALQVEINETYRGLSYSSPQRLSQLQEQLDSLRAADLREQMQVLEKNIEEASAAGEHQMVTASLEQLIRLQEAVNRDFPSSRFASADALNAYLRRREEARSHSMAQLILSQSQEVDALLRARNIWKAAEIIGSLSVQIDSFGMTFPQSSLLGAEIPQKFRFLNSARSNIGLLQDKIYGQLLPVPERGALRMFRTEIPQALYETTMAGANPSRNRDPLLPVDSANHDEATEFSRRVGWLLGLPTRLPSEEEFRLALGRDRYARLIDQTWNLENSGGVTHKVGTREANANGFHDLLGNVSEWLLSTDIARSREARQIGGSIENTVDQLVDVPTVIANALGRNRHNGFRIVVDTTLLEQAPAAE